LKILDSRRQLLSIGFRQWKICKLGQNNAKTQRALRWSCNISTERSRDADFNFHSAVEVNHVTVTSLTVDQILGPPIWPRLFLCL